MKYVPLIAHGLILVLLVIAAFGMMTGYLVMPKDPDTRAALLAIASVLLTAFDGKSLRKGNNADNP